MSTFSSHLRFLSVAIVALAGLLCSLLVAAPADAQPHEAQIVRVLQHADGQLEVVRGTRFALADGSSVLAKEVDVQLHTTGLLGDLVDPATGRVSDAMRRDQWNLDEVDAETAWQVTLGEGQIIAVVDSGVDGRHPDLRDRLVQGFSATGGNPLVDGHGHGTHVAGTVAASIGEGYGVAGLAPRASVMPVQVTDSEGMAYASTVAAGLIWAVDNGATIANLSLAGTQHSSVVDVAIDHALANDVVVVVAGGNEFNRGNPRTYPASHTGVIAVAAMRDSESRASFSSTGDWIDIAAPGASILSTRPDATFGYASGTSMASPLVAGAAALLRSAAPSLTADEVRGLLLGAARDEGRRGWDEEFGHGALDVLSALLQVAEMPEPVVPEIPTIEVEPDPAAGTGTAEQPLLNRVEGLFSASELLTR